MIFFRQIHNKLDRILQTMSAKDASETVAWSVLLIGAIYIIGMACAAPSPCPLQGNSPNKRIQALDLLKNRSVAPKSSEISGSITLEQMLLPGDDTIRFYPTEGASITGYVALVEPGGAETCHCGATGEDNEDTHIGLVDDPKYAKDEKRLVIVEVTPQGRKAFGLPDTETIRKQFLGHWVTVAGWMFEDEEHTQNAVNTNPRGSDLWRATVNEIHPVTAIELSK